MFPAFLSNDAARASEVVENLLETGLCGCAVTGGLAIEARLREHGRPIERRVLNDVDLVVGGFDAIPAAVAERFLPNHIHPDSPEGKT